MAKQGGTIAAAGEGDGGVDPLGVLLLLPLGVFAFFHSADAVALLSGGIAGVVGRHVSKNTNRSCLMGSGRLVFAKYPVNTRPAAMVFTVSLSSLRLNIEAPLKLERALPAADRAAANAAGVGWPAAERRDDEEEEEAEEEEEEGRLGTLTARPAVCPPAVAPSSGPLPRLRDCRLAAAAAAAAATAPWSGRLREATG